jgi:hypothetical protein
MVSNRTQQPTRPPSHTLSVYTVLWHREGGGRVESERRLEGQQFTKLGRKLAISSLKTLINTRRKISLQVNFLGDDMFCFGFYEFLSFYGVECFLLKSSLCLGRFTIARTITIEQEAIVIINKLNVFLLLSNQLPASWLLLLNLTQNSALHENYLVISWPDKNNFDIFSFLLFAQLN